MTTITVPQSCQHSGLTIEEVEAYYSLTPVCNADDGYNYNKTISKILDIYLSTKEHSSKSSKNVKKFRLKEACFNSNQQKNSRVFRDFNTWRLAQISKYATNQNLDHDDTAYLREKLAKAELKIRQLKAENKLLKQQVLSNTPFAQKEEPDIDKSEAVEPECKAVEPEPVTVEEPEPVKVEPEPVLASNKVEVQEPVKLEKIEFKMAEYYDYGDEFTTDEERISYYYKRCQEAQDMCERMYNHNHNCLEGKRGKNINDLQELYYDWVMEESEELLCTLDDDLSDAADDQLRHRHYNMLKSQLFHMTKRPD